MTWSCVTAKIYQEALLSRFRDAINNKNMKDPALRQIMDQKEQMQAQQFVQSVVMQMRLSLANDITQQCFDVCITKPGPTMTSYEKRCIESCSQNYLESRKAVTAAFAAPAQGEE
eukprot:g11120.t1